MRTSIYKLTAKELLNATSQRPQRSGKSNMENTEEKWSRGQTQKVYNWKFNVVVDKMQKCYR